MDSAEQAEICRSFRTVHGLLNSGIFHQENIGHILLRSAFIDLLISLRALMWKSDNYSKRISFTDDVSLVGKVKDVTDLIKYVRDAVCHPDSANLRIGSGVIAPFSVHFGKGPIVQLGGGLSSSRYMRMMFTLLLVAKEFIYSGILFGHSKKPRQIYYR